MQKLFNWLERSIKYLYCFLFLFVTLYPKFPFISVRGTFVNIRVEDFIIALGVLLLTIPLLKRFNTIFKNGIVVSYFIYIFVGCSSVISAVLVTQTVVPHLGFLHLARRIEYFIPFFIGYFALSHTSSTKKDIGFFVNLIIISIAVIFVYGYGQKTWNWPVIVTQNEEYSRGIALRYVPGGHLNSTFAGHYDLSSYLILTLPLVVNLFSLENKKNYLYRVLYFCIILAGIWLIAFSGSRISVVSFTLAMSVSLTILRKYKYIPLFILISVIIFSFSANLKSRYERIFQIIELNVQKITQSVTIEAHAQEIGLPEKRIDVTSTPAPKEVFEDRSTSIRLNIEWPRALRSFYKNPFFGTGFSSITLATDNDFLRSLGETGLLGLLAFVLIFFNIMIYLKKFIVRMSAYTDIEKALIVGFIGSFLGILLNATLIDIFEASKFAIVFWLLTGLVVKVIDNSDQKIRS